MTSIYAAIAAAIISFATMYMVAKDVAAAEVSSSNVTIPWHY